MKEAEADQVSQCIVRVEENVNTLFERFNNIHKEFQLYHHIFGLEQDQEWRPELQMLDFLLRHTRSLSMDGRRWFLNRLMDMWPEYFTKPGRKIIPTTIPLTSGNEELDS